MAANDIHEGPWLPGCFSLWMIPTFKKRTLRPFYM